MQGPSRGIRPRYQPRHNASLFAPLKTRTGFSPGQRAGIRPAPVELGKGKPKPEVVVPVAGIVPVAIGRPAVPGVVVPAAAPVHAVRAFGENPVVWPSIRPKRAMTFLLKPALFAPLVNSTRGVMCLDSVSLFHSPFKNASS